MMSRLFGHHISPELLRLCCAEVLGCCLLAYLLLSGLGAEGLLRWQAVMLALTIGFVSFAAGFYRTRLDGKPDRLLAAAALGGGVAVPAVWLAGRAAGIDFGTMAEQATRSLPGGLPGGLIVLGLAGCGLFLLAVRAGLFVRRLLVIGAGPDDAAAARLLAALRSSRRGGFQVISVLPAGEAARFTPALLKERKVWGIIVTDSARNCLLPRQQAAWRGCRLYGEAEFWEGRLGRIDIERPASVAGLPRRPARQAVDAALIRGGDILLSLALLLFTLSLMLVTAVLIKLDSPGPVLYRQQRVGLHGRLFTVLKFRSMGVDAETRGPVWAARLDPRVTRVGAVIRLARIDELPQLFNVLRGEMSFIGPRPERPHFVDRLAGAMPLYHERNRVKPGLTGWAQVNYPYGASVEDARAKLSYDLYYVKYRSLKLATLILFSTVWVVLFRKGAR
jgi:exopolysaccharide biosynthesis polyprenyl glycosylphosphotransferase